jgi:DnaK suppressor protein
VDDAERILSERRTELQARIDKLAKPPERGAGLHFGKRIGEGTTEAISRLTEIGVGHNLETSLAQVDRALARIAAGSYGICESCGERIPEGRLKAMPESTVCVECARLARR